MTEFSCTVRVYYEDTDAVGLLYHANYLKYMERARSEYLRSLGYTHPLLARHERLIFVVSGLTIEYKKPARLDDLLTITAGFATVNAASIICSQTVRRDADILCTGLIKIAALDSDSYMPKRIPAQMRGKFDHDG